MIGVNGTLDSSLIPVILVYKVINMDIFLTEMHRCASEGLNLWSCMDFFYDGWMDVLFWASSLTLQR